MDDAVRWTLVRDAPYAQLVERARGLGLDPGMLAEADLREAVRQAEARAWGEENAEALRLREAWLDRHGHPLRAHLPDWARALWEPKAD